MTDEELDAALGLSAPRAPTRPAAGLNSGDIESLVTRVATEEGVPPSLALSMARTESGLDPAAVGPQTRFGRAQGLFQIMPAFARDYGVADAFDPENNARGALRTLRANFERFGGWDKALAAHHAGAAAVDRAKGVPDTADANMATADYVRRIVDGADTDELGKRLPSRRERALKDLDALDAEIAGMRPTGDEYGFRPGAAVKKGVLGAKLALDVAARGAERFFTGDDKTTGPILDDTVRRYQEAPSDPRLAEWAKVIDDAPDLATAILQGAWFAVKNPAMAGNFLAEQAPASVLGLPFGAAGGTAVAAGARALGVAPKIAQIAGTAGFGAGVNSSAVVIQGLGTNYADARQQGMPDADAVQYAVDKTVGEVGPNALAGSLMAWMPVASRFERAARRAGLPADAVEVPVMARIKDALLQTQIQGAGGAAGSYTASRAVGEEPSRSDMVLEYLGEAAFAPVEVAGEAISRPRTAAQARTPEEAARLPITPVTSPAELQRAATPDVPLVQVGGDSDFDAIFDRMRAGMEAVYKQQRVTGGGPAQPVVAVEADPMAGDLATLRAAELREAGREAGRGAFTDRATAIEDERTAAASTSASQDVVVPGAAEASPAGSGVAQQPVPSASPNPAPPAVFDARTAALQAEVERMRATPAVLPTPSSDLDAEVARARRQPPPVDGSANLQGPAVDKAPNLQGAASQLDARANEAATSPANDLPEPTDGQKGAGNYKVGRVRVNGFDVSIENPAGSERSGRDRGGKEWRTQMQAHYGYARRTEGADGDHVDVFVKPGTEDGYSGPAFVVDQVNPRTGKFDEVKVMLGYGSAEEAAAAYRANYEPGWRGLRAITPMTAEQFKTWATDPAVSRRAAALAPRSLRAGAPVRAADLPATPATGLRAEVADLRRNAASAASQPKTEVSARPNAGAVPASQQATQGATNTPASDVRLADERAPGAAPAAAAGEGEPAGRAADGQPDAARPAGQRDSGAAGAAVRPAVPAGGGAGNAEPALTDAADPASGLRAEVAGLRAEVAELRRRAAMRTGAAPAVEQRQAGTTPASGGTEPAAGETELAESETRARRSETAPAVTRDDAAFSLSDGGEPAAVTARAYGGREAYERARAARRTKLTFGQWVAVRTPAFKRFFGDWEALRAQQRLDDMAPVQVRVPEAWRSLDKDELRQRVAEALDAAVLAKTEVEHPELGAIRIGRKGANKTIHASPDPAKLLIAADLESVIPRMIVGSMEAGDRQGVEAREYLMARVDVGGTELVATVAVNRQADGRWYYNTTLVQDAQKRNDPGAYASPGAVASPLSETLLTGVRDFVRRLLVRVNPDTVSKVVDPTTGEPLVVYHGTMGDFDAFDQGRSRQQSRAFPSDLGFWLSGSADYAAIHGDAVMPIFVALKSPKEFSRAEFQRLIDDRADFSALRAKLEEAGHDGVIVRGGQERLGSFDVETPSNFVAFRPEQIKSATGNRGTFDPGDPDIRFNLASEQDRAQNGTRETENAQTDGAAQDRDAVARLQEALVRGAWPDAMLEHQPEVRGDDAQSRALRAARDFAERVLGSRVVFIRQPNGLRFNGVVHDSIPGVVFLDVNADKPAWAVFGHELMHQLRRDRPDIYGDLVTALRPILRNTIRHSERLSELRARHGRPPLEEGFAFEELMADVLGDRFLEPQFWAELGRRNPSRFRQIATAVLDFLRSVLDRARGYRTDFFGTSEFLSDLDRARRILADAIDRYAQGERREAAAGDAKFDLAGGIGRLTEGALADAWPAAARRAHDAVFDAFAGKRGFGLWGRTIGTQMAKARYNPAYKRVFDRAQKFIDDIAQYSLRAEGLAPDVLPKVGGLRDVPRAVRSALGKGGMTAADNRWLARVLAAGTLAGDDPSPLSGKVWTDAELRSEHGASDQQIALYRQARAAIDQSLLDTAKATMLSVLRAAGLPQSVVDGLERTTDSPQALQERAADLLQQAGDPDAEATAERVDENLAAVREQAEQLIAAGYAPLMRFGRYALTARDQAGDVTYFSRFDSPAELLREQRRLRAEDESLRFETATMSQEASELFQGVDPHTLMLFAEKAGFADAAMQKWYELAVADRSALKRLIHRKGTAGYSLDARRNLASFLTSNARFASNAINQPAMRGLAEAIAEGDVKDEAVRLVDYVLNPVEEAAKLRGLMFSWYLGGSLAAGLVNITQPVMMTFPYLAQFGVRAAGRAMRRGLADGVAHMREKKLADTELAAALDRAKAEGITEPSEIYALMAASRGEFSSPLMQAFHTTWGANFALTEAFNRTVTFASAFVAAREAGEADPFAFAKRAIFDTQGLYTRANRPNWARGAVGATLFTFKQYSIAYVEFLQQLARQGKLPKTQVALALGILFLASGLQGLPGADDLDDLIDTAGQWLGYGTNVQQWKRQLLERALGETLGGVAMYGLSTRMGLDLQARLGMGNLIPGTGALVPSNPSKARDAAEWAGPAGALASSATAALERLFMGDPRGAALQFTPTAVRNMLKGADMLVTGEARDDRGRRVMDANPAEALVKLAGFNPQRQATESRRMQEIRQDENIVNARSSEIRETWARGIADGDKARVREAQDMLRRWNADNPDMRIRVRPADVYRRARDMRRSRQERFIRSVPAALRGRAADELAALEEDAE